MLIDIVIPTLGREEKLKRCINSILQNTYKQYRLIIVNDVKQVQAFRVWNTQLLQSSADAFMYICDDVVLYPDCLLNAAFAMYSMFPNTDGLVGINQENIPMNKEGYSQSAMGLIGKKFSLRFPGRACFCPDYISFHADAELGLCARLLNKFRFAENACLVHRHPAYYPEEIDVTHNLVRHPEKISADVQTWEKRQKKELLWGRSFELVNG